MAPSHTPDAGDPDDVYDCFESLPDVVWAFEGPDHCVVAANRAARDSVGNRPGLLGLPVREAIPEAVGQQLFEQLDRVYEAGEPLIGRQWRMLVDRDGDGVLEEAWFDFTLMPRRAEDGSVCGVVARCVDVTLDVAGRDLADALPGESAPREGTFADTALTLQRVTLPTGLPVLPQVWLAAYYLAGDEELAAGGDWFDAVPIGRGRVALSVGDVVGHGAEATAAMGQLRIVLAEALMDGVPPTEALARLNRYAIRVPDTRAATTCLAVVDPTVGEIQYGAFGHPAPLVIGQGGATRFLPLPDARRGDGGSCLGGVGGDLGDAGQPDSGARRGPVVQRGRRAAHPVRLLRRRDRARRRDAHRTAPTLGHRAARGGDVAARHPPGAGRVAARRGGGRAGRARRAPGGDRGGDELRGARLPGRG
jgi:serine phosphatase RsbU (regulator of sigma subunit)